MECMDRKNSVCSVEHCEKRTHTRRIGVNGKLVREHRLVMEQILGRPLLPTEEVHHKNTIRHDNDPDNLELWVKSQPAGGRVSDLVEWAEQILRLYAPEKLIDSAVT